MLSVGWQGSITKSAKRLGHCRCGCIGVRSRSSNVSLGASSFLPLPPLHALFSFSMIRNFVLFFAFCFVLSHFVLVSGFLFFSFSLSLFPSPALAFYLCILVCSEQTLISCNLLVANVARQQVERFRRFITQKFTSNGQKQGRRWWRRRWVRRRWCRRWRWRQCKQYLCYATNDLIVSLKDFIIKLDI